MEVFQRAKATDLRRDLEIAQIFTRVGIGFVPMPVLNEKDKSNLIAVMTKRLTLFEPMLDEQEKNDDDRRSDTIFNTRNEPDTTADIDPNTDSGCHDSKTD